MCQTSNKNVNLVKYYRLFFPLHFSPKNVLQIIFIPILSIVTFAHESQENRDTDINFRKNLSKKQFSWFLTTFFFIYSRKVTSFWSSFLFHLCCLGIEPRTKWGDSRYNFTVMENTQREKKRCVHRIVHFNELQILVIWISYIIILKIRSNLWKRIAEIAIRNSKQFCYNFELIVHHKIIL